MRKWRDQQYSVGVWKGQGSHDEEEEEEEKDNDTVGSGNETCLEMHCRNCNCFLQRASTYSELSWQHYLRYVLRLKWYIFNWNNFDTIF